MVKPVQVPVVTVPSWYVFQTRHNSEFTTETQLKRQKFETFVPSVIVDKMRVGTVIGQEKRAMFRSYGFVRFDVGRDYWRPICSTYGVKRLFGTSPEHPVSVPAGVIESLQRAVTEPIESDQDIFIEPIETEIDPLLAIHDEVTILEGVFAGRTGIVHLTDKRRVVLLMDILQVEVPVRFKLSQVRKTEPSDATQTPCTSSAEAVYAG